MNKRNLAFFSAFIATTIYALNHIIAKDVLEVISPTQLLTMRLGGAALLFWVGSIFAPKQRIEVKDFKFLLPCSLLIVNNMMFFLKGLALTTPINSSLIIITTPIMAILISIIFLKEKITLTKGFGVLTAMLGAVILIFFSKSLQKEASNIPLGNAFLLINSTFFAVYLILMKPLLAKYHLFIVMRWIFLISFLVLLPFGGEETFYFLRHVTDSQVILGVLYVVLGTTFLTFALNMAALKHLKASTLSVFTYFQPLIAVITASALGIDRMNSVRYIAAILVFSGVGMVAYKKKGGVSKKTKTFKKMV